MLWNRREFILGDFADNEMGGETLKRMQADKARLSSGTLSGQYAGTNRGQRAVARQRSKPATGIGFQLQFLLLQLSGPLATTTTTTSHMQQRATGRDPPLTSGSESLEGERQEK